MSARRFPATADGAPSAEMRAAFAEDGFLVLDGFAAGAACDRLLARTEQLVAGFKPADHLTIFSTRTRAHDQDRYFEQSGDKIRFFFEAGAVDAEGGLTVPVGSALNKIGHALHDLDREFERFSYQPALGRLARGLGVATPLALQSMVIFKQPRIGGEVGWHQDATYLATEPHSVLGFWLALEDADGKNGGLNAIPGGHREGLKARHYRKAGRLVTEVLDPSPWPERRAVALDAPAGTLVVLHGLLPHASAPNISNRSRRAYALHVIDGACAYGADNWLQRGPDMPLRELGR